MDVAGPEFLADDDLGVLGFEVDRLPGGRTGRDPRHRDDRLSRPDRLEDENGQVAGPPDAPRRIGAREAQRAGARSVVEVRKERRLLSELGRQPALLDAFNRHDARVVADVDGQGSDILLGHDVDADPEFPLLGNLEVRGVEEDLVLARLGLFGRRGRARLTRPLRRLPLGIFLGRDLALAAAQPFELDQGAFYPRRRSGWPG